MTSTRKKSTVWRIIGAALSLAIVGGISAAGFTAVRTWFIRGYYYPQGSLGRVLNEDFAARTNGKPRTAFDGWQWVWSGYNPNTLATSLRWNTNSLLFRDGTLATGATACAPYNGLAWPNPGMARITLLTRRIGVTAGHYWANYSITNPLATHSNIIFLGRTNSLHSIPIQAWVGGTALDWTLTATNGNAEDRYYVILSNAVPDDVEPMRIATPLAVMTNYLSPAHPYLDAADSAFPGLTICQHGCVAPHVGYTHEEYGNLGWHVGGDSGSPPFIIVSNECLYTGGWTYAYASEDLPKAIQTINAAFGFDTNDVANQLRFVSLTNFPLWPYP